MSQTTFDTRAAAEAAGYLIAPRKIRYAYKGFTLAVHSSMEQTCVRAYPDALPIDARECELTPAQMLGFADVEMTSISWDGARTWGSAILQEDFDSAVRDFRRKVDALLRRCEKAGIPIPSGTTSEHGRDLGAEQKVREEDDAQKRATAAYRARGDRLDGQVQDPDARAELARLRALHGSIPAAVTAALIASSKSPKRAP